MQVEIDTTVTYELKAGNRKFTIEAWEFDEFIRAMWKDKSAEEPAVNPDGSPVLKEDGTPKIERNLPWPIIKTEVAGWIKEKTKVEIKPHEVEIIFSDWDDRYDGQGQRIFVGTFSKKKAILRGPQPDSPILPSSSDHTSWD